MEARVVVPVTDSVEDKVVAPETVSVDERVVAPLTARVPPKEIESLSESVADPPKFISPPPVRFVPAETVILELERAEFAILVIVLFDPEIVLFSKVSVLVAPIKVVVTSGKVIILVAVGVQVKVPVGPPD